jgi:predicted RNase H-like HicB family nuclease
MTNYIKTKTDGTSNTVEVSLDVLIKDGDYIVSYCPALELSSFGDTEADAKKAFDEAVDIFLQETSKKGTLEKVLLNLGWQLRKLPSVSFLPPPADFNPYKKPVQRRFSEKVAIPVC